MTTQDIESSNPVDGQEHLEVFTEQKMFSKISLEKECSSQCAIFAPPLKYTIYSKSK